MSLLGPEASERVQKAIADVERNTAGELVVAVVPRSSDYAYARGVLSFVVAIGVGWLAYSSFPTWPASLVFAGQVVPWTLTWWLSGVSGVLRRIVSETVQSRAVGDRTRQAFLELGLTETRDRSGVLLLVSELEHRVQILADRGIHEHVGTRGWEEIVSSVTRGIREKRSAEALCQAIERIGAVLAEAFPARQDDENELPDRVRHLS